MDYPISLYSGLKMTYGSPIINYCKIQKYIIILSHGNLELFVTSKPSLAELIGQEAQDILINYPIFLRYYEWSRNGLTGHIRQINILFQNYIYWLKGNKYIFNPILVMEEFCLVVDRNIVIGHSENQSLGYSF